jgi:hypothetical protein
VKIKTAILILTLLSLAGTIAVFKGRFGHFGFRPFQSGSIHSVKLNWEPSPTRNANGYNVYRSDTTGCCYRLLNQSPVSGLSYTDDSIKAGHTYYYVTTAVDAKRNESNYSVEFKITIP